MTENFLFMCCTLVICVLRNSLYVWFININGLNIYVSLILMVSIKFVVSLILMVSIIYGLSHIYGIIIIDEIILFIYL